MRRLALLPLAALVVASSGTASGATQPVEQKIRDWSFPRIQHLTPDASRQVGPASPRTRVILTLDDPPLAAAANARQLAGLAPRRKLNVASTFSRRYLARLDAAQARAITSLKAAIPSAKVSRRYRVVLNGLAVGLPYAELPKLLELGIAERVYPSRTYTRLTNRGPAIIGALQFAGLTGASGEGIKVAVVDDGVDEMHPFLSPAGFSFPAGFPKGPGGTSPKVIVARGFAGPGANSETLNRELSFHGTFVAGIIAGKPNTDVPAGDRSRCGEAQGGCHPAVQDLSGVAPRAQVGNYRVFNVPDPYSGDCCSGSTAEIVAAFEAAVADGMDIINFSGGGPQSDPRTDALIPAVANVSRAGVVPVISAGNDRDFFGLGTAGSPATAPDAISVGSTTNAHVFGNSFEVVSPGGVARIPFAPSDTIPPGWAASNQRLVDVGTLPGTGENRTLCEGALPGGSLGGAIALVVRGGCQYEAKAARARAAGAVGMVIAENRPGDPSFALFSALPGGVISDLDGARLRAAMAGAGGAATIRFSRDILEIPTTWGGVPASYSAGGLTPFGHALKPDVMAPGSQIISSTLPEYGGDDFVYGDGTSYSAPHVAGAAALLLQRHPSWTAPQMKSALMSTAGPSFADTTLTQEASVIVQGAGLVNVPAADRPLIFTDPQSLSFGYLDVNQGAASRSIAVTVSDAGDGPGAWSVEVRAQVASNGATVEAAPFSLPSGGTAVVQMTARAAAGAADGDNFGFVVLRRGDVVRRLPYAFRVTRPKLTGSPVVPLRRTQRGNTASAGENRAQVYRWPTSPFSVLGIFGVDPSVNEDGRETIYSLDIPRQAVNAGVVVVNPRMRINADIRSLLSSNAPIHPWFLGSLDENDVLGYAGIPINANGSMPDFLFNVGAAGGVFLPPGRYYVSVDSGRDLFNGRSLAGPYVLRSWVNDVRPPTVTVLSKQVARGRPTIVARVRDALSGVDPHSLTLFFGRELGTQVGPISYDEETGLAVFSIPREVNPLNAGTEFMRVFASDFQETKNINTEGTNPFPNSRFAGFRLSVVNRPAVTWITPARGACLAARARLQVVANSPAAISSVGFFDGNRQIARVRRNVAGIYQVTWRTAGKRRGPHVLRAVASDVRGREAGASVTARVCR